uniref:COX6C domain-containing protein n=1 Tax=Strongyloides papillosus TaxID=174720 RepID=A0A0N5CED0_STREA
MDDKISQRFISEEFRKTTEHSSSKSKLLYYLDIRKRSFLGKLGVGLAAYLVCFNAAVFYWKGSDHPLNNFMWRIKKANGTLSKELLEKERVLKEYYESRLNVESKGPKPWLTSIYD